MSTVTRKQPRQKLSYTQKGKQWRKDNVDSGDNFSFYNNENVRQTLKNRVINLNLYNGKVDPNDINNMLNPHSINASFIARNIPHHPIMTPKIDVLIGEEISRNFDYTFTVSNSDAITIKEEEKSKLVRAKLTELLQANISPEEAEIQLQKYGKYLKYNFQDSRERMVNHLMKYYYIELGFDMKFNEGFKDVMINAEEIYQCDIVGDEPTFEKLNNLKVRSVRSSNSSRIEDSDLIIIEDHWSPGKIIDNYYDELKGVDIDSITQYNTASSEEKYTTDDENHLLLRDNPHNAIDSYINVAEVNGHEFSTNYIDSSGNLRVLRVYWRSQKKVFKLKSYDEFGDILYSYKSEEYIADKERGEELTTLWVNEWWEGTKIGKDIYLRMRPRPVQFNSISNPSICGPGIVGEIYNTNQGTAVSLVDKMKNYQYLFDTIWDRTNKGIAKNLGKILLLDISMIPAGWEPDKWITQATNLGIGVVDGFKEGNMGAAQGKLAGNMTSNTRALDLETGNYIQQHMNLLEFIKMEMGEIAGISRQREGNVSNRETVGGIERGVTQSSHITEWWFAKHEEVKKRCLKVFLETAKIALKNNKRKLQVITDDMSNIILDIDGGLISEADYGLNIISGATVRKMKDSLDMLNQAFLQNGGSYKTVLDIMMSSSMADIRNKIENAEDETHEREQASADQQNQAIQQAAEIESQDKAAERELKKYDIDTKSNTAIQTEIIRSNDKMESLDVDDTDLEVQKHKDDVMIKIKALEQDMKKHKDSMVIESKKITSNKSTK